MKTFLIRCFPSVCIIIGLSSFSVVKKDSSARSSRPNLVVILVDQWRAQAQGFEKKEPVKTPVLDRLSGQSLVISQMISNNPVCSPARAMFFSGQYPLKNHVYCNVNSNSAPNGIALGENTICWSDLLKANGYSNGYIGKWHLDAPFKPYIPTSNNNESFAWNEWAAPHKRHGFDYWYAYGTYDEHLKPMYWDNAAGRDDFKYVNEWGPEHEASKALAFLKNEHSERDDNKPFSLVISMNPPHSPYDQVPQKYKDIYKDMPLENLVKDPNIPAAGTEMGDEYRKNIRNYYAAITGVDEQIGRILSGLKEMQLADNTIIVFTADHGNCLGKHDEVSKNNMYEESLRIPMMISWKEHIVPRYDSVFLGSIPDLYPTLMDLMGLKTQIPPDVDGKSYASYVLNAKGKMPAEQFILGRILSDNINSGFRGIRTTDYKLTYVKNKGKTETYLFDLKKDPFELQNLYNSSHKKIKEMKHKLESWLLKTNDPFLLVD
jgi:arylsulfatase A-like enzyme